MHGRNTAARFIHAPKRVWCIERELRPGLHDYGTKVSNYYTYKDESAVHAALSLRNAWPSPGGHIKPGHTLLALLR